MMPSATAPTTVAGDTGSRSSSRRRSADPLPVAASLAAGAGPAATAQRMGGGRSPALAARAGRAVLSRLGAIDNRSPPIEQAGDHQPEREGDEQAGDRPLLDLSLDRLRCRPAAMSHLV